MLPQPGDLLKLMRNVFYTIDMQGRELYLCGVCLFVCFLAEWRGGGQRSLPLVCVRAYMIQPVSTRYGARRD